MGFLDSLKGLITTTQPQTQPVGAVTFQATNPKKILIIEDEQSISEALTEVFTSEGFTVLTAENGMVGLNVITSQKPDVVLLDLMMPVMDGKTMLMKLRSIPEFKYLPVIVLTNAGDADSMRETQLYGGANDFIIKAHVSMPDLVERVKLQL